MITLRGKLKKDTDITNSKNNNRRVSIRDKLLIKEVFTIMECDIFYILICYISFERFAIYTWIMSLRCKRWNRHCQ